MLMVRFLDFRHILDPVKSLVGQPGLFSNEEYIQKHGHLKYGSLDGGRDKDGSFYLAVLFF